YTTFTVVFLLCSVAAWAGPGTSTDASATAAAASEPEGAQVATPRGLTALADDYFAPQRGQRYESPHFVILHDTEPWRARSHAVLLERAREQFYEAFEQAGFDLQPIGERLVCLLFAGEAEFTHYA